VAETKRNQDQAAAAVLAEEESRDASSKDTSAREINSEVSGTAPAAAREISDTDDAKPARRRGRQNGKSVAAADGVDSSSKPAVDPLSPAQLSEAVHDKAVAS